MENPQEKQEEINRRRENREKAWKKYDELKTKFGNNPTKHQEKKLEALKRSVVKVKWEDIETVKNLITSMGFKIYRSNRRGR